MCVCVCVCEQPLCGLNCKLSPEVTKGGESCYMCRRDLESGGGLLWRVARSIEN